MWKAGGGGGVGGERGRDPPSLHLSPGGLPDVALPEATQKDEGPMCERGREG